MNRPLAFRATRPRPPEETGENAGMTTRRTRNQPQRLTPADLTALALLVATIDPTHVRSHDWMDRAACRGDWQ